MFKSRIAIAGALLASATAASAGSFTATPAIVWDYDFRGITQSDYDPAFQLGLDYGFDSGFYVGVWGSTVDFGPGDPSYEVDVYAGYAGEFGSGVGYDVGINYYTYPQVSSDGNFAEIYGSLTMSYFTGKVWYAWDFLGSSESAFYTELNGAFPLGDSPFSIDAHIGYSFGSAWDTDFGEGDYLNGGDGYFDWSIGVSASWSNFDFFLKYADGSDWNIPKDSGGNYNKGRVVVGVSTTLPWGKD